MKICTKICAKEIRSRGKSVTNFIKELHTFPSKNQLQVNYLFKTEISDDTPLSYWDLIRKRVHSKGIAEMRTGSWLDLTCPQNNCSYTEQLERQQTISCCLITFSWNEGRLILRKWEALESKITYLALWTLHQPSGKDVLFTVHTHVRKSVCPHT